MELKERIKELCYQNNVTLSQVESDLGFARGYLSKLGKSTPNTAKIRQIADYFNVSLDYLMNSGNSSKEIKEMTEKMEYYTNPETAQIAQEIFENKDLRALFDASRGSSPEDLKFAQEFLLALKRKETGINDDTGC